MGCHSQVWKDSPMLEPVRASYRTGQPLTWTRVYDVPDFVYFNHSIHIAKGVACENCHGRVDQMPLMRKSVSLHMEWCLECHRRPEKFVRQKEDVFKFGQITDAQAAHYGTELVKTYGIQTRQLSDCNVCHR